MLKNNFQIDRQALEKFLTENGCVRLPVIVFCDQLAFVNGLYQPHKNKIKIFLKPITPKNLWRIFHHGQRKEFFAKVLAHEIGHRLDKKMSPHFATRYWLEIIFAALFAMVIVDGFFNAVGASFCLIFFAFPFFVYLFYKLHPAEIRARRFSRLHWREVI